MLIAVTVAITGLPVVFAAVGTPGLRPVLSPVVPLLLGLAMLGVQLRHSLAAARGERPSGGHRTLLVLLSLVYVPIFELGENWASAQALVSASALMTLRGRTALIAASLPIIGTAVFVPIDDAIRFPTEIDARVIVFDGVYWLVGLSSLTAVLYGVTWLIRSSDALRAARTELAELAIGQERLRVSRDLHDLLGQSLSAVSLKGELALRLLAQRPALAQSEIESLTAVAREALHGVRAVTRGTHAISLQPELDSAARLLDAAGVQLEIDVGTATLNPQTQELFAWAVREAVTNILRHSTARHCSISSYREGGWVVLAIDNDGAPELIGAGTGLSGLSERARAHAGRISAGPVGDHHFRLVVELPAEAA